MYLRLLELEEFRSYHHLNLTVPAAGLRLSGANASGKSSLLEAVVMLATTRSPRSSTDREIINWTSGADLGFPPFARVRGRAVRNDGEFELDLGLQADVNGQGLVRKQFKVNGRAVRAMDAVGVLKAVLFSPEDVSLVSGSPSGRRRYLDLTISQLDRGYLRALSRYNRVLSQRNSLLKSLGRERVSPGSAAASSQLTYWDEELIANGSQVVAHRFRTVARLATLAKDQFANLGDRDDFALTYRPSFEVDSVVSRVGDTALDHVQALVAREFAERLSLLRGDEIRRGVSLAGPHRDDAGFSLGTADLAVYGSRGQQRLAMVALRLAEASLMTEVAGEPPVVLLDDVLSELDAEHRSLLMTTVACLGSQVLITATDEHLLDRPDLQGLPSARSVAGTITGLT